MKEQEFWIVEMEPELKPLLPSFIKNRRQDLSKLRCWIENNNFEDIQRLGHSLQGAAGSFGFNYLVSQGRELELAAQQKDLQNLKVVADRFENFMSHHRVCFIPTDRY